MAGAAAVKRLVLAVAATLALAGVAQAATPSLSYHCNPGTVSCSGWYRVPVKITWLYNGDAEAVRRDCTDQTLHRDTDGTTSLLSRSGTQSTRRPAARNVTIRVDRTQPIDHRPGTRPAAGSQRLVQPSGRVPVHRPGRDLGRRLLHRRDLQRPDGSGVSISGSCRDVAGNATAGAFTLNYDATPPPRPTVAALPGTIALP